MKLISYCNRIIEYSFYLLFFFVPLVISGETSELFEFNKMWLTFGLTVVISAAWITKIITRRKVKIVRTPLDIPILIFLVSQIISTIISLDPHVSFWGYYSRFNGGLLSTITYIILYYAFVSNLAAIIIVKRLMKIILLSGAIVALWGLPSHFGYDPTCLIFRGGLDVSCWTADFQPKVRIFSTMGQPDWLAAFVSVLIPISIYFFIESLKKKAKGLKNIFSDFTFKSWLYLLLTGLFYLDLTYTRSRSAMLAVWISLTFFAAIFLFVQRKNIKTSVREVLFKFWHGIIVALVLLLITFFVGQPFAQLEKITYPGIVSKINELSVTAKQEKTPEPKPAEEIHYGELGGTDSSKIRLIVWEGALNIWKNNPIFGTGVETFAFAYYKYKPPEHNLTSEWNFLYNKAHNEYLNYLATTGILGLGSYLSIILLFIWFVFSKYLKKLTLKNIDEKLFFSLSLIIGYFTILISNFFGFSVVIINLFFFLIPAFFFAIQETVSEEKTLSFNLPFNRESKTSVKYQNQGFKNSTFQWILIIIILGISLSFIYKLYSYWDADKAYAYGMNLNRIGQYQNAYQYLNKAIDKNPNEPVFKNENAVNNTMFAVAILTQKEENKSTDSAKIAESLIQEAVKQTNEVIINHPNNIVFRKSQTRIFYTLSQVDQRYLPLALEAIKRAQVLAPTDANISFNLAVLYGQSGLIDETIATLENTIKLKPDYRDAYYSLGAFYHQKAIDSATESAQFNKKARDSMNYILTKINPKDTKVQEALKTWEGR